MKVAITRTEYVELSNAQELEVAIGVLKERIGLTDFHFVEDGKLYDWDDCRGQGSGLTEFVRDLTKKDRKLLKALKILEDELEGA